MTEFSEIWWQLLILVVCSYLLGNFNIAIVVSKARKKDITKQGSGNPGTMNMYRNFGFLVGLFTLLIDMLKGAVPVIAGWLLFRGCNYNLELDWGLIAMFMAGFCLVIGHVYPVFQKFKGGKGVASTVGVYFAASSIAGYWYITLAVFLAGVLYIYFFEWGSIGSLIITTLIPVSEIIYFSVVFDFSAGLLAIILINAAFTVLSYWKHRSNLKKLAEGRENRTVLKNIFRRKHKTKTENPEPQQKKAEDNQDAEKKSK